MTIQELENTVRKYMLLADPGVVKLLATYPVTLRLKMPPPWLFLIGASSGGKSMLLNAMASIPGYTPVDDMTANAFMSGARLGGGKEASFLFRLNPEKRPFLVFKDFTTILSKGAEARQQIIGFLRKIYDGEFDKSTGLGEDMSWVGKLGLLGGSTTTFHSRMSEFSDMGERIILYTFTQPNKKDLGWRVFEDANNYGGLNDFEARDAMREAFSKFSEEVAVPEELPKFEHQDMQDMIDLADLTTSARSAVERDRYNRDHPLNLIHEGEQIPRFLKQLIILGYGFMIVNQNDGITGLTDLDRTILYKVAMESIPMRRKMVLFELSKRGTTTAKAMQDQLGLAEGAIVETLQDLHAHKLISVEHNNYGSTWDLKPQYSEIIKKFAYV